MTTVATPLPVMLVSAGALLMNLPMPNTIARPGASRASTAASVPASTTKPAPVTPLAPFEVSIATTRIVTNCPNERSTCGACAMEQGRRRHIDVGAVEIEGIAGTHGNRGARVNSENTKYHVRESSAPDVGKCRRVAANRPV